MSVLRASAAEFVPAAPPPPPEPEPEPEPELGWEDDGGGDDDDEDAWAAYLIEGQPEEEEDAEAWGDEGGGAAGSAAAAPAAAADDARLLQRVYPNHPLHLVKQLLDACGGDLEEAARCLADMHFEARQEQRRAAGASAPASQPAARRGQGFTLGLEAFPSLGGGSAGAAPAQACGSGAAGGTWAAVTAQASAAELQAAAAGKPITRAPRQQQVVQQQQQQQWRQPRERVEVPWVETGRAVSHAYATARAEARDHARVRNMCFQQSTLAYRAGNKALAKELSARGKAAAEAMWAAHERASSQLFATRNARLAAAAGGGATPALDLHGLHVREARALLPPQLLDLQARGTRCADLIVGAGHHTVGAPSARLGPAVEALLDELGYCYRSPQPGLLRVQLT